MHFICFLGFCLFVLYNISVTHHYPIPPDVTPRVGGKLLLHRIITNSSLFFFGTQPHTQTFLAFFFF